MERINAHVKDVLPLSLAPPRCSTRVTLQCMLISGRPEHTNLQKVGYRQQSSVLAKGDPDAVL